ncbi:conserved hypothetical protein [Burkholderiales bacterium 8X]|nr:conserved hypothetical protein [Burkholderiales bacterium 8X]
MKSLRVEIHRDLTYGHGLVQRSSPEGPRPRPLKLDLYLPVLEASSEAEAEAEAESRIEVGWRNRGAARPAVVLAFGGAFHRGSKENDSFEGGSNTAIAEYCERLARRGYVACAIDYRLVTEDPEPGATPVIASPQRIPTSRVDVVRRILGLPLATPDQLWRGIESASDDMAAAVHYLRTRAAEWQVDTDRIAVGGFSAGARTALNAAFGEKAPIAAVLSLSGFVDAEDLKRHLRSAGGKGPATLLVSAEDDLDYVRDATGRIAEQLSGAGLACEQVHVPGAGHFYPAEAPVTHREKNGTALHTTLMQAIDDFLDRALAAPPDAEMLQAFADAFNRHDAEALMRFMTPDCVFEASFGSEPCGARHVGTAAVRAAFEQTFADYPDAQWRNARHFVHGDRGVSEWTFTGTRASDGREVEANGVDLFTFEGDRIRIKNSWRKQRS